MKTIGPLGGPEHAPVSVFDTATLHAEAAARCAVGTVR
jgi:hypothetical protein